MKTIFLLIVLATSTISLAAPLPTTPLGPSRNMMKCFSAKQGTVWVSFGHIIRSGENKLTNFPTEIALFNKEITARNVYLDVTEALKVDLQVRDHAIHLGFDIGNGQVKQKHLLQVMEFDGRAPNSYTGNWTLTQEGKEDVADTAYCSVY